MTTLRIYPQDLHNVNYAGGVGLCMSGSRAWFYMHGLDWGKFVRDGIPAETLLATGDAMAAAVVEAARQRYERDKGAYSTPEGFPRWRGGSAIAPLGGAQGAVRYERDNCGGSSNGRK